MNLFGVALLLVRALPLELAICVSRFVVLSYLLFRPDYRREIELNYCRLLGRRERRFWLKNGWRVGWNLALMAKLATPVGNKLIDSAVIYRENIDDGSISPVDEGSLSIMASFHYGLWEFLPGIYRNRRRDVAVVTGDMRNPQFNRIVQRIRRATGVRVLNQLRMVVRQVRLPGVLGFMLDNTSRGARIYIVEGGITFRIPALPFVFGERYGCGVTPVFCYFERGRLWVRVFSSGGPEGCIRALLQMVKERPAEWIFWGKGGAID